MLTGSHLGISGCTALGSALQCWPKLSVLKIDACSVNDKGAAKLAEHVATRPPQLLKSVAFGGNQLTSDGVGALVIALAKCPELKHVDLSCTPMAALPADAGPLGSDHSQRDMFAAMDAERAHTQRGPSVGGAVALQSAASASQGSVSMIEWKDTTMCKLEHALAAFLSKIVVLTVRLNDTGIAGMRLQLCHVRQGVVRTMHSIASYTLQTSVPQSCVGICDDAMLFVAGAWLRLGAQSATAARLASSCSQRLGGAGFRSERC